MKRLLKRKKNNNRENKRHNYTITVDEKETKIKII